MNLQADELPECVAVCTAGELFGGVERHILGVASGLLTHGIRTLLILFHDSEFAAQARDQGIELIVLSKSNRHLCSTSRSLAGILRERQIRVVHAHGYKATVMCALARLRYAFAIVKTEHGLPEPMAGRPLGELRDRLYRSVDSCATRSVGATVCYVTEDLRLYYARAHVGLRTTVIPNGVANMDRAGFRRPMELRRDWFNLIVVGRLDTVKGHHVAIEALAAEDLPSEVHLHILGVGPRESQLCALATSLGVAARVHMLGFRRNVYDYIANCDVLLMPSLHEGLPYTLLEAMALGIPIIASRVGGLAEVVHHETTGLLVAPNDAAALAYAIRRLCEHEVLRAHLGDAARQVQRTRYSSAVMTTRYTEIYRNLTYPSGH